MKHRHTNAIHRSAVRIGTIAVVAALLAACGGSDEPDSSSIADDDGGSEAATADDGSADDSADAAATPPPPAVDTSATQGCLSDLGINASEGDEATTGLSADMMSNLGIDAILTFSDSDGSAGTIEWYASPAQADLAEEGYADSPLGYSVDRVGDIVIKTAGSETVLANISTCL